MRKGFVGLYGNKVVVTVSSWKLMEVKVEGCVDHFVEKIDMKMVDMFNVPRQRLLGLILLERVALLIKDNVERVSG